MYKCIKYRLFIIKASVHKKERDNYSCTTYNSIKTNFAFGITNKWKLNYEYLYPPNLYKLKHIGIIDTSYVRFDDKNKFYVW